jgi:phosphoribosylglycinamide formyltransferase 1
MAHSPIKLAVLASGGGTTLQNLIDRIAAGQLDARVAVTIASRPGIMALQRAARAGIPAFVVQRSGFPSVEAFSREIFRLCDEAHTDLVCLAGWLSLLTLGESYRGRTMNIHPAILPAFGGRGMYGHHVHEGVLAHGCKVSGCTVHFVDDKYDNGPIIVQRTCPVMEDDTPDALAHRVFAQEKEAYPEAIRLFAAGRLKIEGRRVRILPSG